jgi:hypothetical protein
MELSPHAPGDLAFGASRTNRQPAGMGNDLSMLDFVNQREVGPFGNLIAMAGKEPFDAGD